MKNQPNFTRLLQLRRALVGPLAAALALSGLGAQAQTVAPTIRLDGPVAKGPAPVYYVDGQRLDSTRISTLNPNDIEFVNVLKGEAARQLAGTESARGVVLITTKANEKSPEVLAFNKKYNALHPATPAQTAAMAAARAYVEKTYPSAKLQSIYEDKKQAGRYVARFEEGGQTKELHFDGQGQPVAE